jgi:hypothetical protein
MLRIRSFYPNASLGLLLLSCAWPALAQQEQPLAAFTVQEVFGIAHPDQIIDFDLKSPVDAKNSYLIGPNGREVPYQLLEGGKKLAVRTGLPACRYPVNLQAGYFPASLGVKGLDHCIRVNGDVAVGDAICFFAAPPAGISLGHTYFVGETRQVNGALFASLAASRGGAAVAISRESRSGQLAQLAFSADPATNRIYARGHGLRDGDPVSFRSTGELPIPLAPRTRYRVKNADANSFELAADDVARSALITLKSTGTGLHELLIEWTWALYAGRAPARFDGGVAVNRTPAAYEITNGLTGVRIPQAPAIGTNTLAPVQGIRLRDGTWTAAGPNTLSMTAKAMTVRFLENGPLKIVVEVHYAFDRPETKGYGGRLLAPPGEGHYTATITVEAGQPSIMFVEDSDCDLTYSMNIIDGLHPTQARYRGHHANSREAGRETDGQQYRQWTDRPSMDATVDLRYDIPRSYQPLPVWNPWIYDAGWYWQLYNAEAPATANLLGIFAGRASLGIATPWSGTHLSTAPQGVTDLTSALDAAGTLHAAFVSGGNLWYAAFDKALQPGRLEKLASGVVNPDLLTREDGSISVAGYEQATGRFVAADRAGSGPFRLAPIALAEAESLKPSEPFLYQASNAGTDYLFLYGTFKDKTGGLLFARKQGEPAFTFQEALKDASGYRQIGRPIFTRTPDGRVTLLYSQGSFVEKAWLAPGTTLGRTAALRTLNGNKQIGVQDFGASLDAWTGAILVGTPAGTLVYVAPDGKVVASGPLTFADHHGQGPNRRTLAVAEDNTALAVHNGMLFRLADGAWSHYTEGDALQLIGPRVHYAKAGNRFLLLGRKDGMLTLATMAPGDAAPKIARQLAKTDLRTAVLTVALHRGNGNPDWAFFPRVRYSWGLYASTKGDMPDPLQYQPIARQMNAHSGISLAKLVHWQLDYPDPQRGFGAIFMDKSIIQAMLDKLRADKGGHYGRGYCQYLYNAEPGARDLIDMWADATGQTAHQAIWRGRC